MRTLARGRLRVIGPNCLGVIHPPSNLNASFASTMARKGQVVEREPRFVHVYSHEILAVRLPEIDFRVSCSKGFYVRTYAHDIGAELGCGAHLKSLRRTRSGRFTLERAVTVSELKQGARESLLSKIVSLPEVSRLRGA